MMTPPAALEVMNREFEYTTDKESYGFADVWRIMKPGQMKGDCEDFAMTLLWLMAGMSKRRMIWWLITRKARIHFLRNLNTGSGHVELEFEGAFVDNIVKEWNDGSKLLSRYRRVRPLPATFIILKMLVSAPFIIFKS